MSSTLHRPHWSSSWLPHECSQNNARKTTVRVWFSCLLPRWSHGRTHFYLFLLLWFLCLQFETKIYGYDEKWKPGISIVVWCEFHCSHVADWWTNTMHESQHLTLVNDCDCVECWFFTVTNDTTLKCLCEVRTDQTHLSFTDGNSHDIDTIQRRYQFVPKVSLDDFLISLKCGNYTKYMYIFI